MAAINEIALGEHLRTPVGFDSGAATRGPGIVAPPDSSVLLLGAGAAATPITTEVADKKFLGFYTESSAVSGDSRFLYAQHFLSGAGATGDCIRAFTKVNATGVAGGFGLHATTQIQDDATTGITGLAAGARATLGAEAASRALGGTLCALQVDSDIGTGNTFPAQTAFIRVADVGAVKLTNLMSFAAGNTVITGTTAATAAGAIRVYVEGTGLRYLQLYSGVS